MLRHTVSGLRSATAARGRCIVHAARTHSPGFISALQCRYSRSARPISHASQYNNRNGTQQYIPTLSSATNSPPSPLPPSQSFRWSHIFPPPEPNRGDMGGVLKQTGRALLEVVLLGTSLVISIRCAFPLLSYVFQQSADPFAFQLTLSLSSMALATANYTTLSYLMSKTRLGLALPTVPKTGRWSMLGSVLLCLGGTLLVSFLLPLFNFRSREEPMLVEIMLSSVTNPLNLLFTAIGAPVTEELLFRALLFARLCVVSGILPAYVVSAAVFGALHYSPEASKVLECLIAGSLLALSYRMSGTILAPIILHVINNAFISLCLASLSPTLVPTTLNQSLAATFSLYDRGNRLQYRLKSLMPSSNNRLVNDSQFDRMLDDLFSVLDRGNKGYLTLDELAFFATLDSTALTFLTCAMSVIERQGHNERWQSSQSLLAAMNVRDVTLPDRTYFTNVTDRQVRAIRRLYDSVTDDKSALNAVCVNDSSTVNEIASQTLTRLETSPTVNDPHTKQWMTSYYSLFLHHAHRVHVTDTDNDSGSGRVSRERFMRECRELGVLDPAELSGMVKQLTIIAMGTRHHPLAFHHQQ